MNSSTATFNSTGCVCQTGTQAVKSQVEPKGVWKAKKSVKTLAMYATMVVVSTTAIYFLEHATFVNAFRTALVAAVGKTLAANWVCGIFD